MPFREQILDTGFNGYLPPQAEKPKPQVTTLESVGALFQGDTETLARATQESMATIGAAFRMENDVVATVDLLTRPVYGSDPGFDLPAKLKEDGLWNDYSDNFIGVDSEAAYNAVSNRIVQEGKDRTALDAAGTGGFLMQMVAGTLSPTMLLPFVGELRGVKAAAAGVAAGLLGGAAQEIPLQLAQETRTMNESVSSIAMSAVLGGVLGGAVGLARRGPAEIAPELVRFQHKDMDNAPGASAIPKATSAGAAAAEGPVPEFARMSALPKWIDPFWDAHIAPLTSAVSDILVPNTLQNIPLLKGIAGKRLGDLTPANITQIIPTVFNMNARFDMGKRISSLIEDSGLRIHGATPGGTVANRVRTWDGPLAEALGRIERAYAQYRLGAASAAKPAAIARSKIANLRAKPEVLSAQQFRQAIGRAMRENDTHAVPEVQEMAKTLRTLIYDPVFKAAKEEGLFKDLPDEVLGDSSYLNRVYDLSLIEMRKPEFIQKLTDHYNAKLEAEFQKAFDGLKKRETRSAERAEDFSRPPEEVTALRKKFEDDLKVLNEDRDEDLVELEDAISDKRAEARAFGSGTPERAKANAEARALEQEGGAPLAETRETRATINRRLKNLRRAHSALEERQQAKLDKIERAEELSFATLTRLVRRGQKVLKDFDKLSDESLEGEASKLKNQFADTAARYDRNEERIAKIFDDEFESDLPTSPFAQAAKVESQAFDKMTAVADQLGEVETFDRNMWRDAVQAGLDDAIARAQSIVERRAVRSSRLADQAKDLDPALAAKRLAGLREEDRLRAQAFMDEWREKGADHIDPVTGVADFAQHARAIAATTTDRILGTNIRLPGMDMILNPRDAELARTLDIDSNSLTSEVDGRSFLVDDAQELAARYIRTMAPDIELHRALGDFAPDMGRNVMFQKFNEEVNARVTKAQEDMRAGLNPENGKKASRPYTQEQIDRASKAIEDEASQVRRNLEAMIARVRHTWGQPADPSALGARAAKVAANVNVLRFMNMVTVSSFADVGRPIMKHGLLRTFRDGYVPFAKGLANGTLLRESFSERHLRATGAALDVALNSRSSQLFDVGDYIVRGTKFEKALEWGSSKIGVVAMFDYWTAAMKQISGAVSNARLMDSIAVVAGGEKASARDLQKAIEYLAAGGIDDDYAMRIWKESQREGGGELVNGQWWANTENWDFETKQAYNAFLLRDVNNSIITPSVDAPLFMDRTPFRRLIFQFKSFGMASTTRTFMAGLQQRDMAFMTGSMVSLAMGGLSYYTYANIVGGKVLAEMQNDIAEGNYSKFADEMINRSGLLGFGADIQSVASSIPGIADYASFSGSRTTRQGASNLSETLLGPTFGDLLNTGTNIATGAASPTQGTLHQTRTLMPLQNHILFRRIFDAIEGEGAEVLPERRK